MNPHAIANLLEEITPGSLGLLIENTTYPIAVYLKGGGYSVLNTERMEGQLIQYQQYIQNHPENAQYYQQSILQMQDYLEKAKKPRPSSVIHCHEIFDAGNHLKLGILPGRTCYRQVKDYPRGWARYDNSKYFQALEQLKQLVSNQAKGTEQIQAPEPEQEFAPDTEDGSIPETETWGREQHGQGNYERFARKFNIPEEQFIAIPGVVQLVDAIPRNAEIHLKYGKILTVKKENVTNIQRAQ